MHDGMGRGDGLPPGMTVAPAPDEDELAAVAVALAALLDERGDAPAVAPPTPAWAVAGRRAAVRANVLAGDRGWSRGEPRR